MSSLFRIGTRVALGCGHLCKAPKTYNVTQVAFITGKSRRVDRPPRPAPFPYHEKKFGKFHVLTDPMLDRMDDNSKVVVIEGPIAVGKKEFAKELAEELEMAYIPPVTFDDLYISDDGVDLRDFDSQVPKSCRTYDIETFLRDPRDPRNVRLQLTQYLMRVEHYMLSLLHVISTGQGVVVPRSVYSDHVYMKTMYDLGYVENSIYRRYLLFQKYIMSSLLRPHLAIYLDIPVNEVQARIKKRGIPYEVESKVLTTEYLTALENNYRTLFLRSIAEHAHVLIYDWTEKGNIEYIIEDIEELNFDCDIKYTEKMSDWTFELYEIIISRRCLYSNLRFVYENCILNPFNDGYHKVLDVEGGDVLDYEYFLWEHVPSHYYEIGYNKNVLFHDKNKPLLHSMFQRRLKFPYMEKLMEETEKREQKRYA